MAMSEEVKNARKQAREVSKAKMNMERDLNGGKCDYEIMRGHLLEAKYDLNDKVSEIMKPIIDSLDSNKSFQSTIRRNLTLACLPVGKAKNIIKDIWVSNEINAHPNPPETYREDLESSFDEMYAQAVELIEEHREWFNNYPKVTRPLAYKETKFFWGAVSPTKFKYK